MLLETRAAALSGVYFTGQKDCPPLAGLPAILPETRDPGFGVLEDGRAIRDVRVRKGDLCAAPVAASAASACRALYYPAGEPDTEARAVLDAAYGQLRDYFKNERRDFNLPLCPRGTAFQEQVWQALLTIPYGEVLSYGQLAQRMGLSARHSRAVGTAVGRNPLTIIIPCHRVLAANGSLNGYTGGLSRKAALLQIEGYVLS
ncbi:methylated-DNA--[protein]-cysteine S-methyltransferase [Alcaligenaceae bacterium CGII-47]|nr:methylated-DNA--[protein]-cysteine S-methyltransferase [Alcaligenaceae bacterium CGII-47]